MQTEFNSLDEMYHKALKDLSSVREFLLEFHDSFYNRILELPGMKDLELSIISQTPEGPLIIKNRGKFSSSIRYFFYPWLFSDVFSEIDKKDLDILCEIAQLYAESIIELDKVIDNQIYYPEIMQTVVLISSHYKLSITIRKLAQLFKSNSLFWKIFDQLYNDYILQILEDKTDRYLKLPSIQEMERSAYNKVALVKIITAAMGELTQKKEFLPLLEKSQDLFAVGYQLYDDVKDWKLDYENSQYSFLLKRSFEEFGIEEIKDRKMPVKEFGRLLYTSEIIPELLELASVYLEKAKDTVADINCSRWISWIELNKKNILEFRSSFIKFRNNAIKKHEYLE